VSRKLIAWSVVVAVIAAAALFVRSLTRPQPVEIAVWDVKRMDINDTVTGVATGFIEPAKQISIKPDISARIKEVKVRRGDRVKAGQVLVVLDDADIGDQLRASDAAIPLFEARVKEARAHAAQIQQDFQRAQKLSAAGTLTVQQFETAKMALDLGTAELDAAESALRQSRVNRDIISSSLRKTRVGAPFDGVILDLSLEVGHLWSGLSMPSLAGGFPAEGLGRADAIGMMSGTSVLLPTGTALASQGQLELADDSRLFVVLDVDENDYGKLKIGQPAALTFETLGKRKMAGRLVEIFPFISRAMDQNRTSRVKIQLDPGLIAGVVPGMSVNAEILISSRKDVLAAPTASILVRPRGKFVYLVAGGKLKETAVGTGMSNWEWTEITSGLAAGDRVAGPPESVRLTDGLRVVEKDREF
jgi:HlyD family secretion protein